MTGPDMTTDASTVTMHIGELAEKTGLSLRTIRHYDDIGLLKASGRTHGGFRLYSQDDLSRLNLIRRMKPLGFTLDEMIELLRVIGTLQNGAEGSTRPASASSWKNSSARPSLGGRSCRSSFTWPTSSSSYCVTNNHHLRPSGAHAPAGSPNNMHDGSSAPAGTDSRDPRRRAVSRLRNELHE